MKLYIIFLPFFIFVFIISCSEPDKDIKIACVGNSITEGAGITYESNNSYPVLLGQLLGEGYRVLNCGRSATTMLKHGNFPYWTCKDFYNVFAFKPDIIIIKLGTNDTKPFNWNQDSFLLDYQALIDTFRTIPSQPKMYVCYPVPVYEDKWGINDSTLVHGVIPIVNEIAHKNNLPIIDLYEGVQSQGQNFPDGIHPNAKAAMVLAKVVAKEIQKPE